MMAADNNDSRNNDFTRILWSPETDFADEYGEDPVELVKDKQARESLPQNSGCKVNGPCKKKEECCSGYECYGDPEYETFCAMVLEHIDQEGYDAKIR